MFIDVDRYVDRVLISYIAFHQESFNSKYDDLKKATSFFSAKYQQDMEYLQDNLEMQQAQLIQDELKQQSKDVQDEINLFLQLQDGVLLESILNNIASGFNEAVTGEYEQTSIETLIQNAQSFSGILDTSQGGGVQPAAVDQFLSLLLSELSKVASFSSQFITQITGIGKKLGGPSFQLSNVSNGIEVVSKSDLNLTRSIMRELRSVAAEFRSNGGSLSQQQFSKAIASIFNNIAGRHIAAKLLGTNLAEIINMADKSWPTSLPGNIKLISKNFDTQTSTGGNFSSSILTSPVLELNVNLSGKNAIIEIGNSTQVKWFSGKKADPRISIVSKQRLEKYFTNPTERYYAYNILAHSDYYVNQWKIVRASISASFFRDWITGKGSGILGLDKNQFLLINGKLFPIIRIIKNICQEYMQQGDGPAGITISHDILNNSWIGESAKPDRYLALIRSRIVNDVIDTLTISARFNPNMLLKYAY